jgi:hypothetical protein
MSRSHRVVVCPSCGEDTPPIIRRKVSPAGWVTFVVLLLLCLPLFWIGLLMTKGHLYCYGCGIKLG